MFKNSSNRSVRSAFKTDSLVVIHQVFELPDQERQELMDAIHGFHDAVVTAG